MHAAELDRRALSYDGWIPPHLVSWLVEHGHLHEVEAQARGGDWFCAQERVRILVEQDRRDEALEALAPYLATGWWKAARSVAELLDTWARVDEAIAVFRSNMAADWRLALKHFALLLARHGRGDELREYAATEALGAAARWPGPGRGGRRTAGCPRPGRAPGRRSAFGGRPGLRTRRRHRPVGHRARAAGAGRRGDRPATDATDHVRQRP
ncbi:hypothetical protein ACFYV5_30965 [Streptomyces sp. NPDC003035]|uniref:hypothetical protein n=1 Tax=Streptomyces sp. NPDC003035 TaxID=3364676 RepID=UPI0036CA7782